jgi:hypothetical protein
MLDLRTRSQSRTLMRRLDVIGIRHWSRNHKASKSRTACGTHISKRRVGWCKTDQPRLPQRCKDVPFLRPGLSTRKMRSSDRGCAITLWMNSSNAASHSTWRLAVVANIRTSSRSSSDNLIGSESRQRTEGWHSYGLLRNDTLDVSASPMLLICADCSFNMASVRDD